MSNNTDAAVAVINGALSLAANSIMAAQRYQALVERARLEGRQITDDELAAMRAESDRLTKERLAELEEIGR